MLVTPAAPWGTSPDIFTTSVLAPRQSGTSTGVRRLFGQHMCCQRREKASQKSGQHIPEEVLHGVTLLSEDGPKSTLDHHHAKLNLAIASVQGHASFPALAVMA